MFTKKESLTAAVQFFEGEPCICGNSIKWLEEVEVVWKDYPFVGNKNYREALDAKYEEVNNRYPEYNGQVALY